MSKKWRKMVTCPTEGCDNQIRWKGPSSTGLMCRSCYLAAVQDGGAMRQQAITQAKRANQIKAARARAAMEPPPQRPDNLLEAPMDHLWFETERVVEFVEERVGESVRPELSKVPRMEGRWDGWRGRPFVRFDQVDELLCVLGLWVGDLGEPHYSGSAKRYPVLEAV